MSVSRSRVKDLKIMYANEKLHYYAACDSFAKSKETIAVGMKTACAKQFWVIRSKRPNSENVFQYAKNVFGLTALFSTEESAKKSFYDTNNYVIVFRADHFMFSNDSWLNIDEKIGVLNVYQ